jgi:redox-sensing transcriptional repressor
MVKESKIPDATIERIALYSRPLERLMEKGEQLVSSERLAELCNVNPAQVRKDLSYFGEFGVRGIGYDVLDLLKEIRKILVSDREWKMGIVGMGNLGMALAENANFAKRGYKFVAAFDADPQKIGKQLPCGLVIQSVEDLKTLSQDLGIEVGVIATQPSQAQGAADMLIEAGIKAIINFSPVQLRRPKGCLLENVDFSVKLDDLAYHLSKVE